MTLSAGPATYASRKREVTITSSSQGPQVMGAFFNPFTTGTDLARMK